MGGADLLDRAGPRDHGVLGALVVVASARSGIAGEDARVVGTSQDHRDLPLRACGEQLIEGALVQECVAPGDEEAVEVAPLHRLQTHLALVDPETEGPHASLCPERIEGPVSPFHRGLEDRRMDLGAVGQRAQVMEEEDVEALTAHALEALLHRAHHGIVGVVEDGIEGKRVDETLIRAGGSFPGLQQPTDLGRDRVALARLAAQRLPQASLREPVAVVGRGVEVAHALFEGGRHGPLCLGITHGSVEIAETSGAEAQLAHLYRTVSDRPALRCLHRHRSLPKTDYP